MHASGAEILLQALRLHGLDTVFGYPGANILSVYDKLNEYGIRHILATHEQHACHEADGYARALGRCAVVMATSGPGASNLITGIASAYMDSVPMLVITGNSLLSMRGHDCFQEIDIVGMTMPITKHNFFIDNVNELGAAVDRAYEIAMSGRRGPVLLDIPRDILTAVGDYTYRAPVPDAKPKADPQTIAVIAAELQKAQRPVILAGGGVVASGAQDALVRLATRAGIPVATTLMGRCVIPADDPLALGMAGIYGCAAANEAIRECDLLLAVGTRFSERVTEACLRPAQCTRRIVHIDIDAAELGKSVKTDIALRADARDALEALAEACTYTHTFTHRRHEAPQLYDNAKKNGLRLNGVMRGVSARLSDNSCVVSDVGEHQMCAANELGLHCPQSFITSGGLGAMGFGLGAAIGAAVADPSRQVVLITGDGGFLMNMAELNTARRLRLNIRVILIRNMTLGMVRRIYKGDYDGFGLDLPDIEGVARAFGVGYASAGNEKELEIALDKAFAYKGSVILECIVPF